MILDEFTSAVPEEMAIRMENTLLNLENTLVLHITHTLLPEQEKNMTELLWLKKRQRTFEKLND